MAVSASSKEKSELSLSMEQSPSLSPSKSPPDAPPETSSNVSVTGIPLTGDPSDRIDQSESSRKDDEIQPIVDSRSEEYRLLFHLPPEEVLVRDFNCAFQENILLQGHMYLFVHHICFYSNIFGFETKKTIPLLEVTCVRKAKTAAIFPNAIEIVAEGKKLFFGSFLSRDEAYRLIVDGWSLHSSSDKALPDCQDSKSETRTQDNLFDSSERLKSFKQPDNDLYNLDRNKDVYLSEECKPLSNGENDIDTLAKLSEVRENGEEDTAECSSHRESFTWKMEDVSAPQIPECFTMVAESKFPIRVEKLFSLFFSDGAIDFAQAFHTRCGDKDFQCSQWYTDEKFGHARDVSFLHPIKIYFGAKFGHCQEVQKFRVYRNSHLVIETSQQINDVPYGDYFRVEGIWDVEQDDNEENSCCVVRVYVNVAFSRKTMWKGKIEQSTLDECREAYAIWTNNARELLRQKQNVTKVEGITSNATNALQNNDVGLKCATNLEGSSERVHDTRALTRITQRASDSKDVIPHNDNPMKGDLSDATSVASLHRESWATFSSYLKSRSQVFLMMLVITFVIILILMQMSVIVLLNRAPKVHIISQENFMTGLGSDRSEAIAWLERRVFHLKDDMLMVEARLEKMHHEYRLLKAHLQGLEQIDLK
ncbi:protein VASCULAR ASSOCIATED DEATH 1, chloroplastic-like [Tasmannia lanceolata]|uniref:protein VASCULAR ASSOCIATED DEATH 1, chloroplastic-like n=1 Tax=Tasmannia lanceolata TaxID=3420 RepID=UPI004062AA7A